MNLSVIIPALNEEGSIGSTLRSVYQASASESGGIVLSDVIVVDGGSRDQTVAEAEGVGAEHADAAPLTVTQSPRGRAQQMNRGARSARGDVLLFLHADSTVGGDAFPAIQHALNDGAQAGTFRLRFHPTTPLLRLYAACTRLPWSRLYFGDRGLFVTRDAYDAVGGFPDWPIFEDLEMVDRLHRHGPFHLLPATVTTSSRRFQAHGTVRQQLLNAWLWLRYLAGTPAHELADLYRYDAEPGARETR